MLPGNWVSFVLLTVTGRTKKAIEDHFDKSVELEMELEKKQNQELLEIAKSVSQIANIYYIRQKEPRFRACSVNS